MLVGIDLSFLGSSSTSKTRNYRLDESTVLKKDPRAFQPSAYSFPTQHVLISYLPFNKTHQGNANKIVLLRAIRKRDRAADSKQAISRFSFGNARSLKVVVSPYPAACRLYRTCPPPYNILQAILSDSAALMCCAAAVAARVEARKL